MNRRLVRPLLIACVATGLSLGGGFSGPGGLCLGPSPAQAQTNAPAPSAPTQPSGGGQASPQPGGASPSGTTTPPASAPTTPPDQAPTAQPGPDKSAAPDKSLAPGGPPENTEIERGSPGIPGNATTEEVDVPARPIALLKGQSSYDDAFKSIKASIDAVKAGIDKAGLKASGHPITVFSEPDDKGFKFQAAIPIMATPAADPAGKTDPTKTDPSKTDLGGGVTIGSSPAGKAIKFQHRGAYDDIDSTYDVITAYLDAKGMQVDNPYIEEYLTDLTTADDPNLQIDIYVFVKK